MSDFTPFETSAYVGAVQLRWLNTNCYEIKLPNGKTIVTDPFLPREDAEVPAWRRSVCGYTVDDLEGGDYAIVGHAHGDHLGSVAELFDRFGSVVLCHSSSAIHMTTDLMIPQQLVFPFDNNQHYEFDDFTLDTCVAHHLYGQLLDENGKAHRFTELRTPGKGTRYESFDNYGGLFNTDYILTTTNNLRIGFCTGTFPSNERNRWKKAGINVLLRQCGFEIRTDNYEAVAKDLMDTGTELLLPLHHEHMYGHVDCVAFAQKVNACLAEKGYHGRMFIPEQGRWYSIGASIARR